MDSRTKRKVVVVGVAGLALAGAGGAIAATHLLSPQQESQAVVDDAAHQLGIAPNKLSAALKKALENRIDNEVSAGEITKAQGDELEQRIESGDVPLLGFPHGRPGFGHGEHLDAAATYLGLTEAQLETQLDGGKTLAQVANDRGKSVDGLIDALVADAKQQLDAAVAAGRLTQTQEQSMLSDLRARITSSVNGVRPADRFRGRGAGDDLGSDGFRRFGPTPDA